MHTERLKLSQLNDEEKIYHLLLTAPPENRTDRAFFEDLAQILDHLYLESDVRGLIISSQGRHFSSGADIQELTEQLSRDINKGQRIAQEHTLTLYNSLKRKPYPVVCIIQGCCLGSGLELALACDYRIANKNALLSLPETSYSLMPGCGGTLYLPQLVGVAKSIELILRNDNLLAEDALEIGLIDMIGPKGELFSIALDLVKAKNVHPIEGKRI